MTLTTTQHRLEPSANRLLTPAALPPRRSVALIEAELRRLPHLTSDRRHLAAEVRHRTQDVRQTKIAADAIGSLPGPGDSLHLLVSGRFAMFHIIPAALTLAGCRIERLHIATLGFSRRNIEALAELLDAGTVGAAWLLASHYFKGTSPTAYAYAVDVLGKRSAARFVSLRNHCKLLALRFTDGRTLTVESSANLRSCKNLEQMTLTGCPEVYAFHVRWMDELFTAAEAQDQAKRGGQ